MQPLLILWALDYAWGWIELRRLYQEAGRLPDARRAAEQALKHAQSERDRAVAEIELGSVLVASGDLARARTRFEESLKILKRLAASSPSSKGAHWKLGRLPGGEHHWSEALRIALDLQSQGRLAPRDTWMFDYLRKRVDAAEKAEP